MIAGLPREAQLLLRCACIAPPAATRAAIAALASAPLDWARFIAIATNHGLMPLAYVNLDAVAHDAVPKPVMVELWSWRERTARRNAAMAAELLEILAALEGAGIAAIAYKGPALAQALYGDVGLRQFGDLDILVGRADVARAKACLFSRGYAPQYPLAPALEGAYLRSNAQYHLGFVHEARAIVVELHWRTDPDTAVEDTGDPAWWRSLPRAALAGGEVRAFAPTELLLILLVHGSKHRWSSLGWLVDVSEILREGGAIDWRWLEERAAALACERRVGLGLLLAHRWLEAPVPEATLARYARLPGVKRSAAAIEAAGVTAEPAPESALAMLRANLGLYDTASQRFAHVVNTVASPTLVEWSRWPLPRPLFFLYPPLRLARLAWKHLAALRPSRENPVAATPRTPPPPPRWKG
jgi:hypothetical protein